MKRVVRRRIYVTAATIFVLAAIVRGPRPLENRVLDTLLLLAVIAAVIAIVVSHFTDYAAMKRFDEWQRRLDELGVTRDVRADEELFDQLDGVQWEAVFDALSAMPEGSRSLRLVVDSVSPGTVS